MKIILSQQEAQQLKNTARILGGEVTFDNSNVANITYTEDGSVEVTIAEGFISDILNLVSTMAPVAKGVYSHITSTFTLLRTLGEGLESKWAKKPEQTDAKEEA